MELRLLCLVFCWLAVSIPPQGLQAGLHAVAGQAVMYLLTMLHVDHIAKLHKILVRFHSQGLHILLATVMGEQSPDRLEAL